MKWSKGAVITIIALVILIVAAAVIGWAITRDDSSSTTSTTLAESYEFDPGVKLEEVIIELLHDAGFDDDEFVVGEEKFDLSLPAVNSAGNGSFSSRPITSSQELSKFLKGGSVEANRVIRRVIDSTGADKDVVVNVANWIGVQFLIPTDWAGNTYFKDGKIVPAGEVRHSSEGDIAWFFVNPDDLRTGRIIVAESLLVLRGPCGNPQTTPPTPPAPPTTSTTVPSTTSTTVPGTTSTTVPGSTTTTVPSTTSTTKPTTTSTTEPPSSTTTTGGKDAGKASPKVVVPITPEPTRTPTSSTTTTTAKSTTVSTQPDSGVGALTTVPTPTTATPPSTIPGTTSTTIQGTISSP